MTRIGLKQDTRRRYLQIIVKRNGLRFLKNQQVWNVLLILIDVNSELSYNMRHNFPIKLRSALWLHITEQGRIKSQLYKKLVTPISQEIQKDLHRSHYNRRTVCSESVEIETISNASRQVDNQNICNNKLGEILQVYANLDLELKYVQGTNIIVAAILEQLQNQEYTFQVFNYIMNVLHYRNLFKMDLSYFSLLDKRINYEVPQVYKKMKDNNIKAQHCFDYIFFSLFQLTRKELALRILDLFLIEKEQIIFTVIIKILQFQSAEICKCSKQEELILYIRNEMIDEALDKLDDRQDYLTQLLSIYI